MRLMDVPDACPGPVNIGNPIEFTVLDLAERIRRLAGSRSPIIFVPATRDDPRQRRPDISLARQLLGWEPQVSIDEGLRRTIDYFRRTLLHAVPPGDRAASANAGHAAGAR